MGFNDKQEAAISSKANKIIVSAGAGTGKTTVLAERVKRLLINECYKDNTNITNFLILTFTKAAASSMRKKFKKAINNALKEEKDEDKISFLKKQLIYINNADISTIDGFAEKLVKENSGLIGIKSDFDILSDLDNDFIINDCLEELITEEYLNNEELLTKLRIYTNSIKSSFDKSLKQFIKSIYKKTSQIPYSILGNEETVINNIYNSISNSIGLEEDLNNDKKYNTEKLYNFYVLNNETVKKDLLEHLKPGNEFVFQFNYLVNNFEKIINDKIEELGEIEAEKDPKIQKSKELLKEDDKGKNFFNSNDFITKNKFAEQINSIYEGVKNANNYEEMTSAIKKVSTYSKAYEGTYFEDEYKNLLDEVNGYLFNLRIVNKKLASEAILADKEGNAITLMSKNPDVIKYAFELASKLRYKILKEKIRQNKFYFDDIELFAYNILIESKEIKEVNEELEDANYNFTYNEITKTEIAKLLSKKYKYIMVDEYQDTNELQDDLVESLYADEKDYHNNLFLVGDIKQSIYGFRGADVGVFINKCIRFKYESNKNNKEYEYLQLTINYRCQPKIIDAVNDLFKNIIMKEVSGYEYEALEKGQAEDDSQSIVKVYNTPINSDLSKDEEFSESNNQYDDDKTVLKLDQFVTQVQMLICEINRIKTEKEAKGEKFKYSDVAILCRKMNVFETVLCRVLENFGVPYKVSRKGFLGSKEVTLLVNYLRTLHYEFNDVILAEVLVSPIYNFTVQELFKLSNLNSRTLRSKLYEFLLSHIKEDKIDEFNTAFFDEENNYDINNYLNNKDDIDMINKVERFLRHSNHLSIYKKSHNIEDLIREIVRITDYEAFAMFRKNDVTGGELRNIFDLYNFAHQIETHRQVDIGEFLDTIDSLDKDKYQVDQNNDYISYGDNSVVIESIHGSKGLEYNHVFVLALERNMVPIKGQMLFDSKYGICYKLFDFENMFEYSPSAIEIMREVLTVDSLNEEIRLLYVAMTRAKQNLVLFNVESNYSKALPYGTHNIPIFNIKSAGNLLEAMRRDKSNECYYDDELNEIESIKFKSLDKEEVEKLVEKNLSAKKKLYVDEVKDILDIEKDIKEHALPILRKDIDSDKDNKIKVPLRMSVSDIKKDHIEKMGKNFYTKIAKDLTKDDLTGAEKGTIYHFIAKSIDKDTDVKALLDLKLNNNEITEKEYNSLINDFAIEKFEKYKQSDVMKELSEAVNIYREYPFTMKMKAKDVFKEGLEGRQEDEEIIIEGIVDLMYETKDHKMQIVDYKTDKVRGNREKAIKALYDNYQIQLDLYKHAMEEALGKEKEFLDPKLYFFNDLEGIDTSNTKHIVSGKEKMMMFETNKAKLPRETVEKIHNETKEEINNIKKNLVDAKEELTTIIEDIKPIKEKIEKEDAKISAKSKNDDKTAKLKLKYKNTNIYYMKTGNNKFAYCMVNLDNNESVILKDSHIDFKHTDASLTNGNSKRRNELNGLSERNITKENYKVDSPSTAACIVAGGARNGNREWKRTTDGKTLGDIRNNK